MAYVSVQNRTQAGSGYVPVSKRGLSSELLDKPSNPVLSPLSFSTSLSTTPAILTPRPSLEESEKKAGEMVKAAGQGIARAWAATGAKLAKDLGTSETDVVSPSTFFGVSATSKKIAEAVFGRSEPFTAKSEDIEFLEAFGTDPAIAGGTGGGLTMLLSALDLTGAGGIPKGLAGAIKAIRAAKTAEEAARVAKGLGFADDVASQYADVFVAAKTAKEAKSALEAAVKLQNETKLTKPGYVPVAERGVVEETISSLVPLAQEAKKYKSAEEFVSGIGKEVEVSRHRSGDIFVTKTQESLPPVQDGFIRLFRAEGGTRGYQDTFSKTNIAPIAKNFVEGDTKYYTPKLVDAAMYADEYKAPIKYIDIPQTLAKKVNDSEYLVSKSQLTDLWNKARKELPNIPNTQGTVSRTLPLQRQGQIAKTIAKSIEPSRPMITRKARESTLLKEKIKQQAIGGRLGAREGRKIGKAEAENFATAKVERAVRKEQLKALKGGIKLRDAKDKIINKLQHSIEATQEIRKDITDFVKEMLDPSDRGKALTLVRDAKTQRDLTKAFGRVYRWAEDAEKKTLKNGVVSTLKKIMDSPSIAIDYKARIKELMGDFELKGHREETLERLKKTQEFLLSEVAKGNDVEVPKRVLKSLELLNRTPFEEITLNQLTGLRAEIELLEDLGRTKFRTTEGIWEIHKSKILHEIKTQGAEPIENAGLIKPGIGERLTITQKFKNLIWSAINQAARIDKSITPMDSIFDLLDGGKGSYDGANFRFFKGQVDAGYGRYITRKVVLQEPIIELSTKYGLDDTNFERMGVVAAREQDGGMEKLVASGFTEEDVNAIKLAKGEQEVLDLMRSTFDSQFPEIKDVMRKVYNQPVEKVKNYFSFMTDWKSMDESEVFQRFGSQSPEQFGTPRKNVEAGFTKSRVGGEQKIKINALDVFLQHTDNTSYLLELGETSKMLGEVASSPQYAELVGDVGQLMVREWLDVIARKGGASGATQIAILDTLRRNVGAGILGLKLSTIAIQPTSLIDGMGFIGAKYGMKGFTNFVTDSAWRKFVGNMPEVKDRLGGEFALRELTDDNWLQEIQRKGFIPLQKLDQMTAGAVAAGAYERKMIELGETIDLSKPFNKEALAYAQLAVRRTQSSGAFKDVPLAISRGALTGNRSLDRAILQFQNFLLTRWSRIRHDAIRAGINTKDPKKAIPIFTAIVMAGLAGSGIRLGVNKVQDFMTGREDEDTVQEDLTRGFMYEMTGNVPFLGTTVSMAMYDGEMFPILDAPKGVVSGLNRVLTSKSEGAKLRGFAEFTGSTGALLGIPGSAQAEQLSRGLLQEKKKKTETKKLKTPPGLPELPSLKRSLPSLPGLPRLP